MAYTKVLRWILLGGLSLVFFIPFIIADGQGWFPNLFFPYITGKNFAFRLLIEALFGVYVLLALREPKYRPTASNILWAVGVFVAWLGIATLLAVDPVKSFWSNFERMEGYITLLHLGVYFLLAGVVVTTERWWDRFFQIAIAAGVWQAVYSLCQLLNLFGLKPSSQSGARLDGTFGNAAYLGVYMLFVVFIILLLLVRQRRSVMAQVLYGVSLVLCSSALFFTQTRGALLGLVGGLIISALFVAWRARERQWKTLRTVSFWGLGAVAILIVAFLAFRHTAFVQQSETLSRVASISLSDRTTISRFYIWHMAWQGFVDSPKAAVVGWGQENFSYVFNKYYIPQMYDQEQWFDRAHNQFLDWLIAGGAPAFVLYICFFLFVVVAVMRSDLEAPEQAVLIGLLAAYAFNNLFVFDDLMSSVWFFTLLALAYGLSRREVHGRIFLSKPMSEHGVAIAAPIIIVIVGVGMWALNAPGIAKAKNLITAITTVVPVTDGAGNISGAAKDPQKNLADFKTVLGPMVWPGTPLGTQEVTEQLMQFSSGQAGSSNIDPSVVKDTFDLAVAQGTAMNQERKNDARLELFMGVLYGTHGQYSEAKKWLDQAQTHSPQKQQIMFQTGIYALNAGDMQTALAQFKKAYDEEQNSSDARIFYAIGLYYAGQLQAGDTLLLTGPKSQGFGTVYMYDQRLMQVYTNLKMNDRIIAIWKDRVAKNPKDAQLYIGLATAYYTVSKDVPSTIEALQQAIAADPNLASQWQPIIQQLQSGAIKP
ncbi:MAG: hypothetical protein QG621_596 [Patescibacteria group bacterium]|nr:hypothetical protein [Patescibacteria group bacterium]